MTECEAGNSLSDTGGVAARSRKRREATRSGADGVVGIDEVFQNAFLRRGLILDHPARSFKGGFATSF